MPTEQPLFAYDPVQGVLLLLSLVDGRGACPGVPLTTLKRYGWWGEQEDYERLPMWPLGAPRPKPPSIAIAPDMGAARRVARSLDRMRRGN